MYFVKFNDQCEIHPRYCETGHSLIANTANGLRVNIGPTIFERWSWTKVYIHASKRLFFPFLLPTQSAGWGHSHISLSSFSQRSFCFSKFAIVELFCLSAVIMSGTFHSASAQKSQKSDERPLQAPVTARTHHSTSHGYCLVCSFTCACLAFKCSGRETVFTPSVSSVRLPILTLITIATVNRPNFSIISNNLRFESFFRQCWLLPISCETWDTCQREI